MGFSISVNPAYEVYFKNQEIRGKGTEIDESIESAYLELHMRCIGITKSLKRCKNHTRFFLCSHHKFQWWPAIIAVGGIGGLYQDVLKPTYQYMSNVIFANSAVGHEASGSAPFIPFEQTEKLKILIIPFISIEKKEVSLTSHVLNELNELNETQQLGFSIRKLETNERAYAFERMNELGERYGANIVLSGYETANEQLLKYAIVGPVRRRLRGFNPEDTLKRQSYKTASDLKEGFLPTDLKNLVYALQGLNEESNSNIKAALHYYEEIKIPETDSLKYESILLNQGMCYLELRIFERGKLYLDKVISLHPKNITALNGIGVYYLERKNKAKAKKYLGRAIAASNNLDLDGIYDFLTTPSQAIGRLALVYNNFSCTLDTTGSENDSAIYFLEKSIDLDPSAIKPYGNIIKRLGQTPGKEELLLKYLQKFHKKNPHAETANNLGVYWENHQRTDSALMYYKSALILDSCYYPTIVNLANEFFDQESYSNAIPLFKRALGLGKDTTIHSKLAYSYIKVKQTDLAIQEYKRAIELNPCNKIALQNLGILYQLEKSDTLAARSNFKEAVDVDQTDVAPYTNLIMSYAYSGNFAQAEQYLRLALSNCAKKNKLLDDLKLLISTKKRQWRKHALVSYDCAAGL